MQYIQKVLCNFQLTVHAKCAMINNSLQFLSQNCLLPESAFRKKYWNIHSFTQRINVTSQVNCWAIHKMHKMKPGNGHFQPCQIAISKIKTDSCPINCQVFSWSWKSVYTWRLVMRFYIPPSFSRLIFLPASASTKTKSVELFYYLAYCAFCFTHSTCALWSSHRATKKKIRLVGALVISPCCSQGSISEPLHKLCHI